MTGWFRETAAGRPIEDVLQLVDATTRETVASPMRLAIRDDKTFSLMPHCTLIQRNGFEVAIEDSTAPIHDRHGKVIGAVMVFRDVSAARTLALRMSHRAHHDRLTELPNRTLLSDRLTQAIALTHRHSQKLAVLFLDIDRFKEVNDSLGHAIGDRLLQAIAQRLRACVRASDTVSRLGGDEFVVMLPEVTSTRDLVISTEKLLTTLATPYRIDQHELQLTTSVGIALYPDDGTEAETLMANADLAMYCAKSAGCNSYQFFSAGMDVCAVAR
jgi:diguanylate cyclase (GGDEF)-like protein